MLCTLLTDLLKNHYIKRNIINLVLFLILALFILSMLYGIWCFGISSEWVGDFRTNSVFLFSLLFFLRFDISKEARKYRKLLDCIMTIVLIVSCILWSVDVLFEFHPLHSQYNATLSDGGSTMRFIQSYEVLGIALYALFLLQEDLDTTGYIKLRTILFSAAVILFQHRSIWLAWGCGFVIVLLMTLRETRISKKVFLQLILLIVFSLFILNVGEGQLIENISKTLKAIEKMTKGESIKNTTFNTRTEVWDAVIKDLSGYALLIGRPYGYGYGQSIGWRTSPHSGFIRFLSRTGCMGIGLAICLLTYIIINLMLKCRNKNAKLLPHLICVIVFMYGYDYTWLSGVVIGLGCLFACRNNDSIE